MSMWRSYGTDGGYAIEFDRTVLKKLLDSQKNIFRPPIPPDMYDVVYGEPLAGTQRANDLAIFSELIVATLINEVILKQRSNPSGERLGAMIDALSLIKHQGFHEEKEVRIIASHWASVPPENFKRSS